MIGPEALRQKFGQSEGPAHAFGAGDMDQRRRIGEFADALPAAAAWRAQGVAVADDQDFRDAAVTLRGDVQGVPELASGMASAYEKQLREDIKSSAVFESVALNTLSRDATSGRLTFAIAMKLHGQTKK